MLFIPTELIIPFPEILYVTQISPKIIFCVQCICGCMCFVPRCSRVKGLTLQSSYTMPHPHPLPLEGEVSLSDIPLNPSSLLSF